MSTQYLPVTADDANRQQQTARSFYLLGDFFQGVDSIMRNEPGYTGGVVLGPNQSGLDVGIGNGGELFQRGRSGQVGSTQAQMAAPVSVAGLLGNPLVLVGLAVAAYLLLRKA